MFDSPTNMLDIDDDEVPEKDEYFEKKNAYEFSMRLPVKTHIVKIEDSVNDVQNYLLNCPSDLENFKERLKKVENKTKKDLNTITEEFYPQLRNLQKEVKRIMEIENSDLVGLKKQIHQLSQERIKLQNDTLVLENKVVETDKDLGFLLKPDIKQKKYN